MVRLCKIDGCSGEHDAKGYCRKHYQHWKRYGTPHSRNIYTAEERALNRTRPDGDCLVYTGYLMESGYGRTKINGRNVLTHRLSWEFNFGAIPEGLYVLHTCDNRACLKPEHLFLGTHTDNMKDMVKKGRGSNGQ